MSAFSRAIIGILLLPFFLACQAGWGAAGDFSDKQLDASISTLRHIVPGKLSDEEKEKKAVELDETWKFIQSFGQNAVGSLKAEIKKVDESGEKDDFFKLSACALIWTIGKLDEAGYIGSVWDSAALTAHYNYVFYPCIEAAATQDEKALPMLTAVLKDDQGGLLLETHSLELKWPLTHEFLWGAFGPKGLPALQGIVKGSKDPVQLQSAMLLMARAGWMDALPLVREMAAKGSGRVKGAAVQCLGIYGHPQDFDLLISGLASAKDPDEQYDYVFSLYEYEDLRAVPYLEKLLGSPDQRLRMEVLASLRHLLTPGSLEAVQSYSAFLKEGEEKQACDSIVKAVMEDLKMDWKTYESKSPGEKQKLIEGLRREPEDALTMKKDDKKLTHDEFLKAAEGWRSSHRISGGDYEWVESRHVLDAAVPEDIGLLLEVKARLYLRLSDECLYEVRTIDTIVRQLSRRQYRDEPGICEKALMPD